MKSRGTVRCVVRCSVTAAVLLLVIGAACATSVQIGGSEPSLPVGLDNVDGNVEVALVENSKLYDLAGNIGATVPVGSMGKGDFYFFGDMLAWVEIKDGGEFEPRRIVFTLEPGYNRVVGHSEYRLFVKHQSFHDIDFTDDLDEGYELYGLSYRSLRNPEISLRVGKYLNTKDVDYEWDYALKVTLFGTKVIRNGSYLTLWVHRVTEKDGERNGFTDYAAELGFPMRCGFIVFARYEFLHDLDRFGGVAEHHLLIGPRFQW